MGEIFVSVTVSKKYCISQSCFTPGIKPFLEKDRIIDYLSYSSKRTEMKITLIPGTGNHKDSTYPGKLIGESYPFFASGNKQRKCLFPGNYDMGNSKILTNNSCIFSLPFHKCLKHIIF